MSASGPFEIYFDFDNTVTEFDVLDDLIERFSINDDWKAAEALWQAGAIGSRDCLERQLSQVRVSAAALRDYLGSIRIDPAFRSILALLREKAIKPVIVSDSFSAIILPILETNQATGPTVLANELELDGDRPVVRFPYFHSICTRCANCKTSHLFQRNRAPGTQKIYVGDGQSDVCPAGFCEILFAKDHLLEHYSNCHPRCIPFENLGGVYSRLQEILS
ncbi:MAG TPA: MtnX-like HAD-IB family phosphatase [Opitutaceae bacterium]|nr:MtnX-like HAD-IB family phosphatase [Opitutaceae bacterium]